MDVTCPPQVGTGKNFRAGLIMGSTLEWVAPFLYPPPSRQRSLAFTRWGFAPGLAAAAALPDGPAHATAAQRL